MPRTKQWVQTKLGSVATFTNGGAWNASEYVESGIPVVRVTDCQNGTVDVSACKYLPAAAFAKYRKHQIAEGDLIVATVGSHPTHPGSVVGRPIVVPREASGALLNQNAVCIRPTEYSILDKRFLSHFARAPPFGEYVIACARGSANQVRMAIGLLKEMPIEIPLLLTQRKISAILSAYDDLIENNLRRIKILEEMAQNLYREWFVKFRFPGHQRARFTDSPLGRIPEEWEVKRLGSVIAEHIGGGWGNDVEDDKHSEPAWVIRGTDIPDARNSEFSKVPFRYHTKSNLKSRRLIPGDIVFEVSGGSKGQPIGRSLYVSSELLAAFNGDSVICASFCKRIQPDSKRYASELLYLSLLDGYVSGEIEQYQVQSTGISNFKWSDYLEKVSRCVPPLTLQERFCELGLPLFSEIASLGRKNTTLRRTRDLLLPRFISGEVDVSEMDITVPEEAVT